MTPGERTIYDDGCVMVVANPCKTCGSADDLHIPNVSFETGELKMDGLMFCKKCSEPAND